MLDISFPFVVICDNIRSTHNVGAVFRTSDAAGVDGIYLCGITPYPPRPDIDKVSLGAEKTVPFEYKKSTTRLVKTLKKSGYTIIGLENGLSNSINIFSYTHSGKKALLLGGEVTGINQAVASLCDKFVYIPMRGQKESLNVSVAFGIAAYALSEF